MEPTMTSAVLATSSRRRHGAFTLIELLVVIGILVLLVAILVPMSMKAYRAGERTRANADLTTIEVAIEAFKGDFGDIPRPDVPASNSGFACLGRFLVGPFGVQGSPNFSNATSPFHPGECFMVGSGTTAVQYVCVNPSTSAPPGADWSVFTFFDNKEGPGIKKPIGGRAYGPYLQPDKFKMQGLALLDRQGNPILYFPGSPGRPNIHAAGGFVGNSAGSLYNEADNLLFFRQSTESTDVYSTRAFRAVLGDYDSDIPQGQPQPSTAFNGQIDPGAGETDATNGPFLLWSAGPDGIFGPIHPLAASPPAEWPNKADILKCDDVTNFR
jgi:prepilin-type N-terminal cleavage/methylation domain-containing protein